jgi:hypothetical protein
MEVKNVSSFRPNYLITTSSDKVADE